MWYSRSIGFNLKYINPIKHSSKLYMLHIELNLTITTFSSYQKCQVRYNVAQWSAWLLDLIVYPHLGQTICLNSQIKPGLGEPPNLHQYGLERAWREEIEIKLRNEDEESCTGIIQFQEHQNIIVIVTPTQKRRLFSDYLFQSLKVVAA